MKKVLSFALVAILVLALATTVNAASLSEDLYAYISKSFTVAGQEVTLNSKYLVSAKRYLDTHEISQEQYNQITDSVDSVIAQMQAEGKTDASQLSKEGQDKVRGYVTTAAAAVGLTVNYDPSTGYVTFTDENGTVVDSIPVDQKDLASTGATHYEYIAIPVVAIIAVAIVAVYRKVAANA